MRASSRTARPLRATRCSIGLEQLECRALLTVSDGEVPIEPMTTSVADPTPWYSYAQQSSIGSLVMRISLTPGAGAAAEPTPTLTVLQTTFNASKQPLVVEPVPDGGSNAGSPDPVASTQPLPAPQVTGVVFPGQGVPLLPADTWPKPIDAFDGQTPPVVTEQQEYFVVMESNSDTLLGLMSFIIAASSDPALTQGGTDSTGASDSGGLAGLFGDLGGQGGTTEGDGSAAGLAALFAFAALAGLGSEPSGPTVTLVNDTGFSDADGITRDGRLDVTAEPGSRLQYSVDDGRTWRSSYRPRPGVNSLQVRSIDASGAESPPTMFTFTLDRRAPAAPALGLAVDSGRSARDARTNSAELAFGRLEDGASLEYSVNGASWASSYAPVEGRNIVRVRQIDVAGNISKPSRRLAFWLDTQVAAVAIATHAAPAQATAGPQFVGLERGAFIQYSIDGGTSWSRRRPPAAFSGSMLVRQVDVAGNHSAATSVGS